MAKSESAWKVTAQVKGYWEGWFVWVLTTQSVTV